MYYKEQDLDRLENMPLALNITQFHRKNPDFKPNWCSWFHHSSEKNPFWLAEHLYKKYLNRSFDLLYSEWSHRASKHDVLMQYKKYVKLSSSDLNLLKNKFETYFIDSNGIIREVQKSSRKKRQEPQKMSDERYLERKAEKERNPKSIEKYQK